MNIASTAPDRNIRSPYTHAELKRLLAPKSVAIIGSSPRQGSFGNRVAANLKEFDGRLFHVNARYKDINGAPCYPSVADLPEVPDCVVVAVGREAVHAILEDCARIGVGGAIVFASGYAETGLSEDKAAQAAMAALAAETGLRIIGPNCLGISNFVSGAGLTFQPTPPAVPVAAHSIGLISQSGALGVSLAQAAHRGVSFSHMLTSGNSCDVDVADYISFLVDDPDCGVIACGFEGVSEPQKLIEAAQRAWKADKPLILYKMAASEQGSAAAMSHSGTFAGSHASYQAALGAAGAVMVDSLNALIEVAAFFGKVGRPTADGVAVLATSGGAAIMAADAAQASNVALPPLNSATYDFLSERVPEYGSVSNPCDVTAQVVNDPQMFADCTGVLFADPAYSAIITPHVLAQEFAVPRIAVLDELARQHGKIACNVWVSEWLGGPGSYESEAAPGVALFYSMESCFSTLALWQEREKKRQLEQDYIRVSSLSAAAIAQDLLRNASGVLTERQSKRVLAAYGIPVAAEHLVKSAQDAISTAQQLGTDVVLKGEVPDVAHKSDAGLVKLRLAGAEAIEAAYTDLELRLADLAPDCETAIILQPMIPQGVEIMVGGKVDDQFGPMLVVGLGGVFVELLRDTVLEPAPVNKSTALNMLERLRGAAILDGFRHLEKVDRNALADVICRFSELLADQADLVSEVDINPLICSGDYVIAVDGLITMKG